MTKSAILIVALSAAAAAAAAAETPANDPNEVVCRIVSATGSRLAQSRRCATRAQWAEDERAQRAQFNERTLRQTNPSQMTPGARAAGFGRSINVGQRPVGN